MAKKAIKKAEKKDKKQDQDILLSRQQLADLRGCTAAYVSRRQLPKSEGRYDLKNHTVKDFMLEPYKKIWEREQRNKEHIPGGNGTLEDEKIKVDIMLKNKQGRKLDLQHEIAKRNLVPSNLMAIWMGYISVGIRTYFLPIGNRVARGNTKLRDRIEKEITKAIEKTLDTAERGLKEEGELIANSLEEK